MVNIGIQTCKFDKKRFERFCKRKKIVFPQSYVSYLEKHNDGELENNIISTFDNDYYIRYFYGTTNDDFSNLPSVYDWYVNRLPNKCIPIADPDFGNQVCISLDFEHYGKIYFWDHETMDTDYGKKCHLCLEDMVLLADSFEELLEKITAIC